MGVVPFLTNYKILAVNSVECGKGQCCLTPKGSIILVAIVSLAACLMDMATNEDFVNCFPMRMVVTSLRHVLITLFQVANVLLLLSTVLDCSILVQIYLFYTLGFVVVGFLLSLLEFMVKIKRDEPLCTFMNFALEVGFLFVVYWCLPVVEKYKLNLDKNNG